MTLAQAITLAAQTRPNTFTNDQMTDWINDLEAAVQTDIWLRQNKDLKEPYIYNSDSNKQLLVNRPFEKLYVLWLRSMVSQHRDEPDLSSRSFEAFEKLWGKYTRWFAMTYAPAMLTPMERETLYAAFTGDEAEGGGNGTADENGEDDVNAGGDE